MAISASQVLALVESHAESDDHRFYTTVLQMAAKEARAGHNKIAQDLSDKVKHREIDLLIVVNMFLTGFDAHGATPEIIKVMQEEVGDKCKVKGSGCIRTREHFLQLIDMGIDRMGVGYRSVPVVLDLDK